jgi:hypothetical protein
MIERNACFRNEYPEQALRFFVESIGFPDVPNVNFLENQVVTSIIQDGALNSWVWLFAIKLNILV